MSKRPLIGIITARVSNSEQKQLLFGMSSRAEQLGADTAVFSNIYNFDRYFANTEVENKIYDLIISEQTDGLIFIADSVLNTDLQQHIFDRIRQRNVPSVIIGSDRPGLYCIDSDVSVDFEGITRHICEEHHFTKIDFLTGPKFYETSHLRVEGCRRALRRYGLELPEENIIFGDFWMSSGEELARSYIEGRRPLPDVILCANDYMAYGICDTLITSEIRVPEDVSVIGYEFSGERYFHAPILTTYLRNRGACGAKAVEHLMSKIEHREPQEISLAGHMICGDTCPCGTDRKYLNQELQTVRRMQFYLQLNFASNFEQQLTLCRNIRDYIHVLQEFGYLVRDCCGIYLCLYEGWYSEQPEQTEDALMVCYRVISPRPGTDEPQFYHHNDLMPEDLPGSNEHRHLYFAPIFFAGRELGYFILEYDKPDSYDEIFSTWLKIAVNGLEELRLKNDILSLLECRNLSEHHDTTTGLFNRSGFENEVSLALREAAPEDTVLLALVRTSLFTDDTSTDDRSISVRIEAQVVECLRKMTVGSYSYAAKLDDRSYAIALIGSYTEADGALLQDKLRTLILHTPLYSKHRDLDTLQCAVTCTPASSDVLSTGIRQLREQMEQEIQQLAEIRRHVCFTDYAALRQSIFRQPQLEWDAQETCQNFHLSYGHFRAIYKELFGYSFHQDLIRCRISYAKHLLLTTPHSLQSIAYQCGYEDDKYFLRQFRKLTGMTPNQYRNG